MGCARYHQPHWGVPPGWGRLSQKFDGGGVGNWFSLLLTVLEWNSNWLQLSDRGGDLKWRSYVRVKMRVKKLTQTD